MTIRIQILTAALAAALSMTACGVVTEDTARQLPTPYVPGLQPATVVPGTSNAGQVFVRLFLIKDDALVPIERPATANPNIDELLRILLSGPTSAERDAGITSALLGSDVVTSVELSKTLATVELAATLNEAGRTDDILALAQVVCTLTARAEINGVYFVHNGQRINVPRADGSLSPGPLTLADYVSLLIA